MNPIGNAHPDLPRPDPQALAHSAALGRAIASEIDANGGFLPFSRYMHLALFAPGLGYYMAGARRFGPGGDFVTAPELGTLFGRTLAHPVAAVLARSGGGLLEFGAGSGALAHALLGELARIGTLPGHCAILELSPDLRERQRERLAPLAHSLGVRIEWLEALPETFAGVMVANEVLDAMPVDLVTWHAHGVAERGVGLDGDRFVWRERPLEQGALHDAAQAIGAPAGTTSEIGLAARRWIGEIGRVLARGAAFVVDYGFPAREYYHPQRSEGTLMCHYRHRAHDDPLIYPGLQDITAHVDFSAMASAAAHSGLDLSGYTTQADFLLRSGLLDRLSEIPATDAARYLPRAAEVQRLTSPAEMGELFKVLALSRGIDAIPGFPPSSGSSLGWAER